MRRFLDTDFTQTAESIEISDALLAVPQLQKSCCEKANHMMEHCFDTVNKTLKYFHQPEFFLQLDEFADQNSDLLDSKMSVEDFESPSDCYSSCTADDAEVIPSSYPDSEICFDLEYNLDSPEDITGHNPQSKGIFDFEAVTHERMEEGKTIPFEEPIITDNFTQAASRVVATKVLFSRLQMSLVEDPLYDSNGKLWSEQNFFKEDHNLGSFTPTVFKPCVTETNDLLPHVRFLQTPVEEYLTPPVINNTPSSYTEDFEILTTNIADLYGQQSFTSKDLDFSDAEALLNQECKVLMPDTLPDLPNSISTITSFVDLNNRDAEPQCFASSPFVGFSTPPVARNDIINEFCQNLEQSLALSPDELKADFVGLLASQKGDNLIREFVEKDLHYDEKRLREPVFHHDSLTDPVLEALQCLDLPLVKNICLIMEDALLKNLTESLHEDLTNPVLQVSTLKCKFDVEIDPFLLEEHVKLELTKQDSHQYEKIIPDSSLYTTKSSVPQVCLDEQANSVPIGNNPLDTFMLCRTNTIQTKNNEEETIFINNVMDESGANDITGSSEDQCHTSRQGYASKIMKIPFTGPYSDVMKCITDYVSPHFDKAKQYGRIPHNQSFIGISVDKIRFLYKESEQLHAKDKSLNTSSELNELQKNLLQSYAMLLHGRITLDLLLHACLESAITHLSSCIDSDNKNVGGSLVYLHEDLFKTQIKFMESNCHHPKFTALINELETLSGNVDKVVILAANGLLSLQQALQRMLHRVTSVPIHVIHGKESLRETSAKQGISILLEGSEMDKKTLEQYSLIIQYNALNPKMKFLCDSMEISYIGFISEVPHKNCCLPPASIPNTSASVPLTIISSNEVTQYKNLLYLLEARYNILIVERNYVALKQVQSLYYADFILSLHHCIVLLALHEMYDHWDLETFITRMVAVGFQCSFCYVIAHGIGAPSRYLLDKNVLLNLYKLRASLSNLSRSSTSFTTTYKVLICSNEDEVALNIRAIADQTVSQQEGNSKTSTLKTDMSKEEIFLLQFACFNSYSAQRFLSLWTVDEILKLDPMTIKRNIPNISHDFLATFEVLISQKKETDCISISSESPPVLSVTSSKSHSSVVSTDKGSMTSEFTIISEDDNVSLMSSKHSERSVCENKHDHALECKRTQVCVEGHQAAPMFLKNKCMDRQEHGLIKNIGCSSFLPESPGQLSEEIVPQHDFEMKEPRKRSAISNVEDGHLKIPRMKCGYAELPSNLQVLSKIYTNDKRFSMAEEKTARQYLYEKNRIDGSDFYALTKPQESHHIFKESCRKMPEHDCFTSCTDCCCRGHGNSMKYPLLEATEKNGNISNGCLRSSHMIHEIDADKDFFEKKTLQFENSENFETLCERTILRPTLDYDINGSSHIPKPKSAFYKSDLPTCLLLQNAQEDTKHTNSYGIFSDKIYRTYYKNDKMKDAKQALSHNSKLNSEAKRTEAFTSSSHYLCTENKSNVKRDYDPVTYLQPQIYSSKRYSTVGLVGNSHPPNDISFPVRASASQKKPGSDKINYIHLNEGCSRFKFKSGTDCGSSSFAASTSSRRHKKQSESNYLQQSTFPSFSDENFKSQDRIGNCSVSRMHKKQPESSFLQHSTFPSFSEENLKSQDKIENHSVSFPLDLHLKIRANKQIQNEEINFFEKDLSHQPSPDILSKFVKNDSEQLHNHSPLKRFKKYTFSPKYERPTLWNRPGHYKDADEDCLLHFSPNSENFDLSAPLFEHQIRNIHPTSLVPSPPMDFMEELFRNLSE